MEKYKKAESPITAKVDKLREILQSRAVFSFICRFFNVTIAIKSDHTEPLEWFRRLYPRFRIQRAPTRIDATYYLMVKTPKTPLVIAEEGLSRKVKVLDDVHAVTFYAHQFVLHYIATHLKSHFLLHGAALSGDGHGIAIMGNSYAGKTTLTLELLRKGFRFLSDDQLAINRTTHQIEPFPRSVGIREGALSLFDELELEHRPPHVITNGQRKWFVDISDLSPLEIGETCRLRYLFLLVNRQNEHKPKQWVELTVDCINDKLFEKLQLFAKTEAIQSQRMESCYLLSFPPSTEAFSTLELERICESCGVWLLDVRKHNITKPNFSATPILQPIPRSVAAFELLEALCNDCRAEPCQTYMELAGMLQDVDCFRLSVGRLDEMAKRVSDLVRL